MFNALEIKYNDEIFLRESDSLGCNNAQLILVKWLSL